jgi:hypothetical protein
MIRGYLRVKIRTKYGRETALVACNAKEEDLNLIFWGDKQVRRVQDLIGLSRYERTLVAEGSTLGKYASRPCIERWVTERKEFRIAREESIERTEKALRDIHKLFLKEQRMSKAITSRVNSDIISSMDGSTLLWLNVILAAKKDFLKGHEDSRRIDEWDLLVPQDLLDQVGNVKRGNEEAWAYITARDFLFSDQYYINIGSKDINCKDLLDTLIESCNNKQNCVSIIDPSIKHLRASLAKKSGDPKLIELYSKKK